jgi:solute carrier family 8 (sodium/calcium exchanger)
VSEAAGFVTVVILNKHKAKGTIGVRTVEFEGTAQVNDDYTPIDEVKEFNGEASLKAKVEIVDDENWEPDEDFYIELYDRETGKRLVGDDTRCRVTILDDDMPGFLCFLH